MRTGIAIFFFDKVSFLKHPNAHGHIVVFPNQNIGIKIALAQLDMAWNLDCFDGHDNNIRGKFDTECDVPVPGIFHFFGGFGTGIGTNWYRKKVSEPVSVKFGIGKKSRNRYGKNLVPKKGTGIGIENI